MKNKMSVSEIKNNASKVSAKVKELLNVGCSPTHALDIAAVACGYKNYQTAKGLLGKQSFYHITTDVGTAEVPFLIERPLGFFKNDSMAQYKFQDEMENCKMDAEWKLFRDGIATEYHRQSTLYSHNRKGYALVAHITGENEDDLENSLNCIISKIGAYQGNDGNKKNGYSFTKYGDEVRPNVFDIEASYEFAIISDAGFALETDNEEEAEAAFEHAGETGTDIVHWKGELVYLELISIEDFFDDSETEVVLVDHRGYERKRMPFHQVEEFLNYSDQTFYVFRETKRKGAMNR
ncbi:hypothetical protein OTK49_21090 [Vibrio coralliirubri]|uniref:hypothetical protein n=1 Tax=Vibrio coralliirubri TaxID=1516159 RepID=UPI0022844DE9|nr:hypothetical protein [Vibrio coralliirubri]MCY9865016.1 hypothetical protein [Vibrio coralliirubri]